MQLRTLGIANLLFLAAFLAGPDAVMGASERIRVEAAIPSVAARGHKGLSVKIQGKNFGPDATVKFLVTGTDDDSQIDVLTVEYDPITGDLDTVVNVDDEATLSGYDIQVRRGGRGGKGTDLFRVRNNGVRAAKLAIKYFFGVRTDGKCTAPECTKTKIIANGTVECGNLYCDFRSTSVEADFDLPSGLRDLLGATEWRGTPLNPDNCFGYSGELTTGSALIDNNVIFLRRDNDGTSPWYASVGTRALDVDGLEIRQHIFNFEGCRPNGNCGKFAEGMMEGTYAGAELLHIYSHGNDKKFLSIPCRCTRSNTPNCPSDVPVPTPPMKIKVTELIP